jgi:hypothetical protein
VPGVFIKWPRRGLKKTPKTILTSNHASIKMGGETQKVAKRRDDGLNNIGECSNPSSLMDVLQFGREKVTKLQIFHS